MSKYEKEELMKLEGMTEELAKKIAEMSAEETKDMIPRSRLNEVIAERDNAKKDHADVLKQLGILQKDSGDVQSLKDQIRKLQDDAKEAENGRKGKDGQSRQNPDPRAGIGMIL